MGKPSRRENRRNRPRRVRGRQAAAALDLSIVTHPAPEDDAHPHSLRRDIELVRSALLYADHIELVSLRTVIIGSMLQVGIASEPDVIDIMVGLDDNMLRYMNGGEDVDPTFRSTLSKVAAYMRLPGGLNRHMDRAAEMMRETLAPTMEQFRSNALNMFEDSELAELVPAFQSGIVELSRSGITDGGIYRPWPYRSVTGVSAGSD